MTERKKTKKKKTDLISKTGDRIRGAGIRLATIFVIGRMPGG
jgi:hypothetical protein